MRALPIIWKRTALQVRAAVDAVLLDDTTGAVSGVRLMKTEPMSGRQLEVLCPCVVSTAGVINTFTKLLRPDVLPTCTYCLDYSTLRITLIHPCFCLDYSTLRIRVHFE